MYRLENFQRMLLREHILSSWLSHCYVKEPYKSGIIVPLANLDPNLLNPCIEPWLCNTANSKTKTIKLISSVKISAAILTLAGGATSSGRACHIDTSEMR
jgi:hypothetical protein